MGRSKWPVCGSPHSDVTCRCPKIFCHKNVISVCPGTLQRVPGQLSLATWQDKGTVAGCHCRAFQPNFVSPPSMSQQALVLCSFSACPSYIQFFTKQSKQTKKPDHPGPWDGSAVASDFLSQVCPRPSTEVPYLWCLPFILPLWFCQWDFWFPAMPSLAPPKLQSFSLTSCLSLRGQATLTGTQASHRPLFLTQSWPVFTQSISAREEQATPGDMFPTLSKKTILCLNLYLQMHDPGWPLSHRLGPLQFWEQRGPILQDSGPWVMSVPANQSGSAVLGTVSGHLILWQNDVCF